MFTKKRQPKIFRTSPWSLVLAVSLASLAVALNGCVSSNSPQSSSTEDQKIEFTVDSLLGMQEFHATEVAQTAGWSVRVIRRDDEWMIVSQDYLPNRANLEIENGFVVAGKAG